VAQAEIDDAFAILDIPQLNDPFGERTFFPDSNGLNIVEPAR
jgi:hypothetical protein